MRAGEKKMGPQEQQIALFVDSVSAPLFGIQQEIVMDCSGQKLKSSSPSQCNIIPQAQEKNRVVLQKSKKPPFFLLSRSRIFEFSAFFCFFFVSPSF